MKNVCFIIVLLSTLSVGCVKESSTFDIQNKIASPLITPQADLAMHDDLDCARKNVNWANIANELNTIANCNYLRPLCESGQTIYNKTYSTHLFSYCFSGGCPTCASLIPSPFTPIDQDAIIAAAQQFAQNIEHPCGNNAAIQYTFYADNTLCVCGTDCGNGNIVESNSSIDVMVSIQCCLFEVALTKG